MLLWLYAAHCCVDGWPTVVSQNFQPIIGIYVLFHPFPRLLWILNIGLGKLMVVDTVVGGGSGTTTLFTDVFEVWSILKHPISDGHLIRASAYDMSYMLLLWYHHQEICSFITSFCGNSLLCSLIYSYSHSHLWSILWCPMISQKGFASGVLMQKILHSNSWTRTNGYIHRFWQTTTPIRWWKVPRYHSACCNKCHNPDLACVVTACVVLLEAGLML